MSLPRSVEPSLKETLPHLPAEKPVALVCTGETCFPPAGNPAELLTLLERIAQRDGQNESAVAT